MSVLDEIAAERARQEAKWGEQNHPDAYEELTYNLASGDCFKAVTEARSSFGMCSYADILLEEVAEAVDEARAGDKAALRTELIQVAAVATKWVEKLDRGY
ncbi:hypothetical protein SEA_WIGGLEWIGGLE_87 [Mycobacterium phage Wigglewiggle]|nr:hypothetical protein SEA_MKALIMITINIS3_89 [Mycobacterium phage MkaliMitinis3]QDH92590.1 hypothetical protein SEA_WIGGLEWIGGLE_87 [Mycobacterium phage Wigglewiggle]